MKERIINEIIRIEGGYTNNPADSGGETNFGITIEAARANGYSGDMRDLPREVAFGIYVARYWAAVKADDLSKLSDIVTEEVVDTAVNMGPSRAGKFLQRTLNVLNSRGKLYPDVVVDGAIGPATVSALRGYLVKRDANTLAKALNCLQGAYYITLAERREKDETFVYGWFKHRVKL